MQSDERSRPNSSSESLADPTRPDDSFEALLREVAAAPAIAAFEPAPDLVGRTLSRFRVVEQLGEGGMGVVYAAVDETLERRVALKVLSRPESSSAHTTLLREARSAAAVNHPNIAAVYEVGAADGVSFIAMELVEGTTLRRHVSRFELSLAEVVRISLDVARGLASAHKQGIVHRDLKPDNVMIAADGLVKILDFGLARPDPLAVNAPRGNESRAGRISGTPAYMSPEQSEGRAVDPRSDVYSFGVMLVELSTGKRPDQSPGPVPESLRAITERCLKRDPAERFANGTELAAALETARAQITPRPSRKPWIAATIVALAATGAIYARRARPPILQTKAHVPAVTSAPSTALTLKRLTANIPANPIVHAALSPDGNTFAYIDTTGLYVQRIGAATPQAIALPKGTKADVIAWLPDGQSLLVSTSTGEGTKELVSLRLATLERTHVANGKYTGLSVSPDGKRVAFAEADRVSVLTLSQSESGSSESARTLTSKTDGCVISELAWSPDGGRVAYLSLCFHSLAATSIETIAADGDSKPNLVVGDPRLFNDSVHGGLVWSSRGDIIYPLAEWLPAEAGSNLYGIAVDAKSGKPTASPRRLTNWIGTGASMLSADATASKIAFVRFEGQSDVYLGDLENNGRKMKSPRRFTLTDRNERPSTFSRDGKDLFFFSDRNGNFDVFAQAVSGGPARSVVATEAWETMPQLAPDGESLLFWQFPAVAAGEAIHPVLARAKLSGGPSTRVLTPTAVSHPAGAGRPQPWEMRFRCARVANGPCVLSERDGEDLVFAKFSPDDGQKTELFRFPHATAAQNLWDLSPDGTRLAIPSENGPVTIRPLATGKSSDVKLPDDCDPMVPTFHADGGGLFVSAECPSDAFRVYTIRFGEPAAVLFEDAPRVIMETEASPDGTHLAIAVRSSDDDVWLLSGL